jgi:microcompartment protein CcmK/EutM
LTESSSRQSAIPACRLSFVICQPLDAEFRDEGTPVLAIDRSAPACTKRVLISTDGSAHPRLVGDPKSPLRNSVIAIVDRPGAPLTPCASDTSSAA